MRFGVKISVTEAEQSLNSRYLIQIKLKFLFDSEHPPPGARGQLEFDQPWRTPTTRHQDIDSDMLA